MINFSVTRDGKPLYNSLYTWDKYTKTFSTNENFLTLNFKGIDEVKFITGSNCTFYTGSDCTFNTWSYCKFTTGSDCIFIADHNCEFKTKNNCIIIRHDTFEVVKLQKEFNHIKLNDFCIKGYTEVLPTDYYTWK